jgi:hypothetical protein
MKTNILLLSSILFFQSNTEAQVDFGIRGPANLDTSKLAHIYIIRDGVEDTSVKWVGVWADDNLIYGLGKVHYNSIYRINTSMIGKHTIWTMNGDLKDSVELTIEPSKNYFLEAHAQTNEEDLVYANLDVIQDSIAEARIRRHQGNIIESYGVIPIIGEIELIANVHKDSINWLANKNYFYRFVPIGSWECIRRGPHNSEFYFFSDEFSKTFKENGGIVHFSGQKKMFKSNEEFERFCKEDLIETHFEGNMFATIKLETQSIVAPEGFSYACLTSYEGLNSKDTSELKSLLVNRLVSIAFQWKDEQGKSVTAAIFTSEIGLQKEVHSMKMIQEELLTCWKSFRLISLKSINAEIRTISQ